MKTFLLTAMLALCAAAPAQARGEGSEWLADFDAAAAVAREQGKDLFVNFTGSDWCVWCHRLRDEVFVFDTFLEPAKEHYVLVALDFPNGEEAQAAVPNPERNAELQEQYGVQGFPTCLLMTPDGEVFARMGYQAGGPDQYVSDMTVNAAEGKARLKELAELQAAFAAATDKLPVIERAIGMLGEMDGDSIGVSVVAGVVRLALEHDAENAAGLKQRALVALLSAGQADEGELTAARELDPKNELGLLEQVVGAEFGQVNDDKTARKAIASLEALLALDTVHDAAEVKNMTAMAALWCEGPLEDHEHAVELAERVAVMEGELHPMLQERVDAILG